MNRTLMFWVIGIFLPGCVWAKAILLSEDQKAQIIHEEWQAAKTSLPQNSPADVAIKPPVVNAQEEMFNQKITLSGQGLELVSALKPIAEILKRQLLLEPGVENTRINIDVHDVPLATALTAILLKAGYGYEINEHELWIKSRMTRVFQVLLPPVIEEFHDTTSNESSIESDNDMSGEKSKKSAQVKLGARIVVDHSSRPTSFWDDVSLNLKSMLSADAQFSINQVAGMVIITDKPAVIAKVQEYFDDLNKRVSQQIEVNVKVVEVSLNNEHRMGVDWNVLAENLKTLYGFGLTTNFGSGNFTDGQYVTFNAQGSKSGSGVNDSGIKLAIDALSKQGDVQVVSQPRVTILNNQVAIIQVGSTQSYIDQSRIETTQTGTITTVSTSQVQQGVTMRLMGNIVGDDVYLSVTPVVTSIENIRSINTGTTVIEAPQTTTKSINTMVKLKQGQTAAIGGLITDGQEHSAEGIPVVSKIPLFGKLFQYHKDKKTKTELVIFITPKRG